MPRAMVSVFVLVLVISGAARDAAAQQSLNIYVGGFAPADRNSRQGRDVLVRNREVFLFNINDFSDPMIGAEWLVQLGDRLDAGLGAGIYSDAVESEYAEFVNSTGADIKQEFRLRLAPITATVRFLPIGRQVPVQPYVGGGVGIFAWNYREAGEFVDFDRVIFPGKYEASGATAGPVVLGGLRLPAGRWALGFEARWHAAKGKLPSDEGFFGSEIDLGGMTYLGTFNMRF